MKSRLAARVFKLSATLALPSLASAHPGHDGGHDLTWDLSGGIEHALLPLGTLIAMGLIILVVKFRQSRKTR